MYDQYMITYTTSIDLDIDGVTVTRTHRITGMSAVTAWVVDHAAMAATATIAATKRAWRIMHAVMDAAKRHIPWLALVFTACLIIPGPFDEIGAAIIVAVYAAFKPDMRSDLAIAFRTK